MTTRTSLLLASLLFIGVPPQQAQDQAKPAAGKDRFVIEPGEHELLKIIEASARFLGRNYLLSPTEVGGGTPGGPRVTLQNKLELDAAGCEAVVSQIAYANGLIATPLDRARGIWEFVNVNGAKRGEAISRGLALSSDAVRRMRDVRVYVITSVKVQHLRASVAAQTLGPFFAGAGGATQLNVGTAGSERALLLSGIAEQVAQAIDMIAEVDQPQPVQVDDDRLAALEARVKVLEQACKIDAGKPK